MSEESPTKAALQESERAPELFAKRPSSRAPCVLFVDDNPDVRGLYGTVLRAGGYETLIADGGREALRLLETRTPDLVILDHDMPGMDGLAVLETMRAGVRGATVPVVFLTGHEQQRLVEHALCLGAVDYIMKPVHHKVLLRRIATIVGGARNEQSRLREQLARRELAMELSSAREVQQLQLPTLPIVRGNWEVTGCLLPCTDVGGDMFDVIEADDGSLVVTVVDVSGHGLGAAMVASCVRGMLKALGPALSLVTVAHTLNRRLESESGEHYACVALVRLTDDEVQVVNAGLPPISVMTEGRTVEISSCGVPPGLMEGSTYEVVVVPTLGETRVVIATDGLTEAFGSATDTSTYLEGMGLTRRDSTPSPAELRERAQALFLAIGFDQPDDATVLVLDRRANPN